MSITTVDRPRSPLLVFRDRLVSRRDELAHALEGTNISVDRFIRTATTAMQINPDLAECSFQSLWIALLKACRDQLLPDGAQGAIIAFKKQAQWLPMFRGMISRFERSGHYKWIHADFHRADDRNWDVFIDEHGQHFLHRPGARQGAIIETYAAATTQNGAFFISVVSPEEMERIRAMSRAQRDDAPWNQWPEEMMKKTALRRLCKILPMPAPIEDLVHRDAPGDDGNDADDAPDAAALRPRGVAAALEQFASEQPPRQEASSSPKPDASDASGDGGEAGQNAPAPSDAAPAAASAAAADAQTINALTTAYQRGQKAKADGMQRKAIPPEYRDAARSREAVCWQAGFDGSPLPAFSEGTSSP